MLNKQPLFTQIKLIGNHLAAYFQGFLHLFYPHICLQCATDQLSSSQVVCDDCESQLPFTHFSTMLNSPVEKIFWGRVGIQSASAILFFTKESIVQKIIFELKYKQNKKAGYLLGKLIAQDMMATTTNKQIDYLIPIPVSKRRERERGFNQSKIICEGMIHAGIKIPLFEGLTKVKNTSTQTSKDRLQRGKQPTNLFHLSHPEMLTDKNVMLIDDVLTTGATLEAAIHCIQLANPAMIHIATAAYTTD